MKNPVKKLTEFGGTFIKSKGQKATEASTRRTKVGIEGAQAYNSSMRGGAKAGISAAAGQFIADNPNATKPGAPRLTEKYR